MVKEKREKEILPPRKSLRIQGIDADTGLKLPEKEPTSYNLNAMFNMQNYEEEPRLPLENLSLDGIMPSRDKREGKDIEQMYMDNKSKYLANISECLKMTDHKKLDARFEGDVAKNLQRLRITVSLMTS